MNEMSSPVGGTERVSRQRFGLLSYPGLTNLGDEIQSIAARAFLPQVDSLIPREVIDRDPGGEGPIGLILNGWFMEAPDRWPPHPRIAPLITSFHLATIRSRRRFWRRTAAARLLSGPGRDYLCRHGPVGARDRATLTLLEQHGVEVYHSGCLTLTLDPPMGLARGDEVIACDLPPRLVAALAARLGRPPVVVTHHVDPATPDAERFARAERLLALYAGAKAVVATRLHAVLPCLALGTPVLFLTAGRVTGREAAGTELAHHGKAADFLAGRCAFDPADPPPNPTAHLALAADLRRRCAAFAAALSAPG